MWLSRNDRSNGSLRSDLSSDEKSANVDLRKLRRLDLLELLVDQIRENEQDTRIIDELTDQANRLAAKLDERDGQIEYLISTLYSKDVEIAALQKHLDIAPNSFVVFSPDVTVVNPSEADLPEGYAAQLLSRAEIGADDLFGIGEAAELEDTISAPANEAEKPMDDIAEPAEEAAEPANESVEPANESDDQDEEAAKPSGESTELAEEAEEPADDVADEAAEAASDDVENEAAEAAADEASAEVGEAAEAAADEASEPLQIMSEESISLASALEALKPIPEVPAVLDAASADSRPVEDAPSASAADSMPETEVPSVGQLPTIEKPSVGELPTIEKPSVGELPTIEKPSVGPLSTIDKPTTGKPTSASDGETASGTKNTGRKGLLAALPLIGKTARKPRAKAEKPKLNKSEISAVEKSITGALPFIGKAARKSRVKDNKPKLDKASIPTIDATSSAPAPAKAAVAVKKPAAESAPTEVMRGIERPATDSDLTQLLEPGSLSSGAASAAVTVPIAERPELKTLPTIGKPELDDSSIPAV